MYLDAVEQVPSNGTDVISSNGTAKTVPGCFAPWKDWHPTLILHHGRLCCEITREWLIDTDFSEMNGAGPLTGPRWLSSRFQWGPCSYPLHWCEAGRHTVLDCGAHAALAHEVFTARGVKSFRAQFVQRYSLPATSHWTRKWKLSDAPGQWISDDLIYHEGCAVITTAGRIKLWDASAGWWIDPRPSSGYGSLTALRLSAPANSGVFSWGPHFITPNQWQTIG